MYNASIDLVYRALVVVMGPLSEHAEVSGGAAAEEARVLGPQPLSLLQLQLPSFWVGLYAKSPSSTVLPEVFMSGASWFLAPVNRFKDRETDYSEGACERVICGRHQQQLQQRALESQTTKTP